MSRIDTNGRPTALSLVIWVVMSLAALSCETETTSIVEPDRGPIEATLDEVDKTVWPGIVDDEGNRFVKMVSSFFDEKASVYWFWGFASRAVADVFIPCYEGEALCPLDERGRVNWTKLAGNPVFARIPGQEGFSPFWLVWTVTVPKSYPPNALKSVEGITAASQRGEVSVKHHIHDHGGTTGKDFTITHCNHLLEGTSLERQDVPYIVPSPTPSASVLPDLKLLTGTSYTGPNGIKQRHMETRKGWHKGYRVGFIDFSKFEGVFAPDKASPSKLHVPTSDIFIMVHDCAAGSQALVCSKTEAVKGTVSERSVGVDFTGDGDMIDTNNVLMGFPGATPPDPVLDKPYSPLWRVMQARVNIAYDEEIKLIDRYGQKGMSDVKSSATIRKLVDAGKIFEPVFVPEGMFGTSIPGNDGLTFFDCPAIVPDDYPFP